MTLYDELQLQPDCSFEDIKQQYRTLASIHHPDKGGDEEKFKRIKFAYEVLSEPIRRKQYDLHKSTTVGSSIHTEAINTLANLFFSIIPTFNCHDGNLVETLKQETQKLEAQANAELMLCDVYIGNLEVVKKKLQHKKQDEENILLSFVIKQIEARETDKKLHKHRLELAKEMLLILDNYNYGFVELFNEQSE